MSLATSDLMDRRRLPRPGGRPSLGDAIPPARGLRSASDPVGRHDAQPPPPDPTAEFRAWLVERVRRDGLTHQEVARRSGVHRTTIARLISGERGATLDTALRIVRGLDRASFGRGAVLPQGSEGYEARFRALLDADPEADDDGVEHLVEEYRRLRGR